MICSNFCCLPSLWVARPLARRASVPPRTLLRVQWAKRVGSGCSCPLCEWCYDAWSFFQKDFEMKQVALWGSVRLCKANLLTFGVTRELWNYRLVNAKLLDQLVNWVTIAERIWIKNNTSGVKINRDDEALI